MAKIKLGVAQINYRPVFFQNQNDLLVEPFGDTSTSISKMTYQGSDKLKRDIKNEYVAWIRDKVVSIIKAALLSNTRIILFPEYSIPHTILNDIVSALSGSKLIVIAGTHVVVNDNKNLPNGYPEHKSILGTAMCPVLSKDGLIAYTLKTYRASEEINNINLPKSQINDEFEIDGVKIKIKICIDAISGGSTLNVSDSGIVCIPSLSRKTEPFNALSVLSRYNEIPVIYANISDVGGSLISGAFDSNDSHWFKVDCSTKPVHRGCECLVIVNAEVENMRHGVGTVKTTPAMNVEDVYNIFYQENKLQKECMQRIDCFLSDIESVDLDEFEYIPDPLFAEKISVLQQDKKNNLLTDEKASNILKYVRVNSCTLDELKYQQADKILTRLTSAFTSSRNDPFTLPAMESLTKYINQKETHKNFDSINIFEDDSLYLGRDEETAALGDFFNEDSYVIFLHGVRGIGKSKILNKVENTVLPIPSPWDIKTIIFDKGVGYEYIVDKLESVLGLRYIDKRDLAPSELAHKMADQIITLPPIALLIDDFQYCADLSGKFLDKQLTDFFISFISRIVADKSMKLILASNRKIPPILNLGIRTVSVTRLDDKDIKHIINYCARKLTNSVNPINIQESTIRIIYGNPLAALIIAQLIGDEKLEEFEKRGESFGRFQEQQIKNLLGEITLSQSEKHVFNIMSVANSEIPLSFFDKYYMELRASVDSLINRLLIEKNEDRIRLHPLFKDFFYDEMELIERTKYHMLYSRFYEQQYDLDDTKYNPDILANAIYHFAGSKQQDKLQKYQLKYIDSIKPIADQFYRDKNYDDAVSYYTLIYNTNKELRHDVLIKMSLCYVYCDNLKDAKKFFELAIQANPRGAYLYAQYSNALASKRKNEKLAYEISMEAEQIYVKFGNYFNWELAQIKFAQGRAQRNTNPQKTLELYAEACELDETNVYHLCMYAKALYETGAIEKANEQLKKAEIIDEKYYLVIKFKSQFEQNTKDMNDDDNDEYSEIID